MDVSIRLEVSFTPETTALLDKFLNVLVALDTSPAVFAKQARAKVDDAHPPASAAVHDHEPPPVTVHNHELPPVADAPQSEPVRKRRGRPPASAKPAEQQAAAMEQENAPQPSAIPSGAAIPPGVTMQMSGIAAPPGVTAPAMPAANGAMPADGETSLDDLRECIAQANTKNPRIWLSVFRNSKWSDGTDKPTWFTVESVPPEMRERVIEEISQAFL